MNKLLERRRIEQNEAFVKVEEKDCKWIVNVYGRVHYILPGPTVVVNLSVPWQLMTEIENLQTWQDDKTPFLKEFIQKCYEKAAERDEWFKPFVNL